MSNLIYHYCPVDAMRSIVESRTVWLTHALHLNDYTEYVHFSRIMREEVLTYRSAGHLLTSNEREVLATIADRLAQPDCQHHCFSCSSDRDVLSQWRAYAEDGTGFTLGFERDTFSCSLPGDFRVVGYDESDVRHRSGTLIRHLLQFAQIAEEDKLPSPRELVLREADAVLALVAMSHKQSGFLEEQEVRYVYTEWFDGPDAGHRRHYRSNRGRLIPYYAASFDAKSLKAIGFGPRNAYDLNRHACELLLSTAGYAIGDIQFYRSRATYR